ncbi:MAG: ABC transporter ATP-binding protein [Azospira oryzae]|nr:MAG: ABC transporter ATP-binding protein [Azospira oryzae]PZP83048.1 MAG: ABC transporter ATP-binding protein [Azospira oryzae]
MNHLVAAPRADPAASPAREAVVEVDAVVTRFGASTVHDGVSFRVWRGEVVALIGGSGSGKSVLLREIIGLARPTAGRVRLLGTDVWTASEQELKRMRRRFGMLFQDGALFSSLSVAENIAVPIKEHTDVPEALIEPLVRIKLAMAGLPSSAADKMPSELSGGMRKRAALARALALEPEILFLDEPTSGLDPISARSFDRLIQLLNRDLGITVFIVTHDLDTLYGIIQRVLVLSDGKILADGPVREVARVDHPWVREYFHSRQDLPR